MRIAGHDLSASCFIAAELSSNHNGELGRARKLIRAAKAAGATGVKFQAFTLEEILGLRGDGRAPAPWDGYTTRELYQRAITPADWFPALFEEAHRAGLVAFASVFGAESLAMLEHLDCPAYKIAKPERDRLDLLAAVRATGKPVLVSGRNIYCPGGYPCPPEAVKLPAFGAPWLGLSSHCRDPLIGAAAVARGARYVEAHFTLDDGIPTLDDPVNLTAAQFVEMVSTIRRVEAMLCR